MFRETRELLEKDVRSLQVQLLHPRDAVAVLAEVTRIKNLASAAEVLIAPRAAEANQWARDGFLSPEQWLAAQTGTSEHDAKGTLKTGEKLRQLPEVENALRNGDLSGDQAEVIVDGASENPEAQGSLLDAARKKATMRDLKEKAERAKAAGRGEDAEAQHVRIHRARTMYSGKKADGSAYLTLQGTTEAIARWKAIHKPFLEEQLRAAANKTGERERLEAIGFDAAMAMAEAAANGGNGAKAKVPAKLFLRVDYAAFCRGFVEGEELCELDGFGPVPVSVARDFAEDAFIVGLLTKGVDVMRLAHFGRRPKAVQQSLVEWNATRCQVEACNRRRAEIDHGAGWAKTHETRSDDLRGFCDHHHDLKTYKRYRIAASELPGKVRLVPPDDPDPPPRR